MSGSSNYPEQVDNHVALQDGIDIVQADDHNDSYAAQAAIQTFIGSIGKGQSYSTDLMDFLANLKRPIFFHDGSALKLTVGNVCVKDAAQSVRLLRRNTAELTIDASVLDTGSWAVSGYYLYAVGDTAASTFTVKASLSSSAPSGASYYKKIGWLYNEGAGSFSLTTKSFGMILEDGIFERNKVSVQATSTITTVSPSFVDMTSMLLYFYSDGKRKTKIDFTGFVCNNLHGLTSLQLVVDGSAVLGDSFAELSDAEAGMIMKIPYQALLSQGFHTIKVQWKASTGTSTAGADLLGNANKPRTLEIEEV